MKMAAGKINDKPINKHKGGRPRKGIRRSTFLMVRMTATEKLLIEGKAKKACLTPSEWFRQAAKSAQITPRFSPSDIGYLNALTGMANNLNQLTRLAHIKGITFLAEHLEKLLAEIASTITKLFTDGRKANIG